MGRPFSTEDGPVVSSLVQSKASAWAEDLGPAGRVPFVIGALSLEAFTGWRSLLTTDVINLFAISTFEDLV